MEDNTPTKEPARPSETGELSERNVNSLESGGIRSDGEIYRPERLAALARYINSHAREQPV